MVQKLAKPIDGVNKQEYLGLGDKHRFEAEYSDIKADKYLQQCGDSTKLINRKVEVGRGACIPASLTYLVSLGIWQWCPARVSWDADVQS